MTEKSPGKKKERKPLKKKKEKGKGKKRGEPEKKEVKGKAEKPAWKKEKKVEVPATKEEKKLQEKIKTKTRAEFRGRFGKSSIRRKSRKKWRKWRKPRGIDVHLRPSGGRIPKSGYGTARKIRGLHPCGKKEVLVRNEAELSLLQGKNAAVRIAGRVGKKKRAAIRKKCAELGAKVLN